MTNAISYLTYSLSHIAKIQWLSQSDTPNTIHAFLYVELVYKEAKSKISGKNAMDSFVLLFHKMIENNAKF